MKESTGVRGSGWTGGSSGVENRAPIPAAELTGDTQDRSHVTQVHFHGGDLSSGVAGQDEVSRVFVLLGVAAGDTEVDAAILLQQPLAQRQPHAAAKAHGVRHNPEWVWGEPGRAATSPSHPGLAPDPLRYGSIPPLTCWPRSPTPLAPSQTPVPATAPPALKGPPAREAPPPPRRLRQWVRAKGAGTGPRVA